MLVQEGPLRHQLWRAYENIKRRRYLLDGVKATIVVLFTLI